MAANIVAPVFFVALAALVGTLSQPPEYWNWYSLLVRSPLEPPGYVFSIVWTIIYLLMAYSWVRVNYVLQEKNDGKSYMIFNILFLINVILNGAWSVLFFNSGGDIQTINGCLVILLFMIITVIGLLYFCKDSISSFICLFIYLLWLCFAFYLNFYIVYYN